MQNKIFVVESHDRMGVLIKREDKMIEDNPAYGEQLLQHMMSNNPSFWSVSISELIYDAEGNPTLMIHKDGEGNPRFKHIERMRFTRDLNEHSFRKTVENWNHA